MRSEFPNPVIIMIFLTPNNFNRIFHKKNPPHSDGFLPAIPPFFPSLRPGHYMTLMTLISMCHTLITEGIRLILIKRPRRTIRYSLFRIATQEGYSEMLKTCSHQTRLAILEFTLVLFSVIVIASTL